MKRVGTPLFLSLLLAAGGTLAQTSSRGGLNESTDPARAADVEQRARSLGDTGAPAGQSGMQSGGQSGMQSDGQSETPSGPQPGYQSGGESGAQTGAEGGVTGPTGTEDMSGTPSGTGRTQGTGHSTGGTGNTEAEPGGISPGTSGERGTYQGGAQTAPDSSGQSGGDNLKSAPEPGEMTGTEQLHRPKDRRFTEPTQPAR